jgi:hypothetical protein
MKSKLIPSVIGVLILLVAFFALLQKEVPSFSPEPTATPTPKQILTIGEAQIEVEVADTPEKMRLGLGERDNLPENSGMIFPYPEKSRAVFWMKGMRFPLDIIWIADDTIVQINENVPDEPGVADNDLARYLSNEPVNMILEVNAGFSEKNDISVGDIVLR